MSKNLIYYNIHDILKISSNVDFFPSYFKCGPLKKVDLEVRKRDFNFNKSKHGRLGLTYWGGGDSIYYESKIYGQSIQKVLISGLREDKTKLYFKWLERKRFAIPKLVFFIFALKLLQRGHALVHASGILKEGKGYMFPAWAETGKSAIILDLSKKEGIKLLGDDVVILSKDGTIYAYPLRVSIYSRSKNIRELNLSLSQKVELKFRSLVARLPPLYLYIYPNITVEMSQITEVGDKGRLDGVFLLEYGEGGFEKTNKKSAIRKIMLSPKIPTDVFFVRTTFDAYCYLNNFDRYYVEKTTIKILDEALNDRNTYIIRDKNKNFSRYLGKILFG